MPSKFIQSTSAERHSHSQSANPPPTISSAGSSSGEGNNPYRHDHLHSSVNVEELEVGQLENMLQSILLYRKSLPTLTKLRFNVEPSHIHEYQIRYEIAHPSTYTQPFDLHLTHSLNTTALRAQKWLFMMINTLENFEAEYVQNMKQKCLEELYDIHMLIEKHKETEWHTQLRNKEAKDTLSSRYIVLDMGESLEFE